MYWVEIPMYNVFTRIIEAYDSISKNPGFEELNIPKDIKYRLMEKM